MLHQQLSIAKKQKKADDRPLWTSKSIYLLVIIVDSSSDCAFGCKSYVLIILLQVEKKCF